MMARPLDFDLIAHGNEFDRICDAARKAGFVFKFDAVPRDVSILHAAAEFVDDLKSFGIFTLPFPQVIFAIDRGDVPMFYIAHEVSGLIRVSSWMLNYDGKSVPFPLRWDYIREESAQVAKPVYFDAGAVKEDLEEAALDTLWMFELLCGLLRTRGIDAKRSAPTRQQKRAAERSGRELFSHWTVRIASAIESLTPGPASDDETKRLPPRLHWRRGHVRRRANGKLSVVRPALVGDKARGYVHHDYRVKP